MLWRWKIRVLLLGFGTVILTCAGQSCAEEKGTLGEPQLVLSVAWGEGDSQFSASSDFWDPSFQYFDVNEKMVFALDVKKRAILYFNGGRYARSFPLPSYNPVGLIYANDLVYYFAESGGVAAISVKTGEHIYTAGIPEWVNQDAHVFLYGRNILVILREGKVLCLARDLKPLECPHFSRPRDSKSHSRLRFFSNGDYAYLKYLPIAQALLFSGEGDWKGVVTGFNESELRFEVPGAIQLSEEGVYYVKHNEKTAEIWFSPWAPPPKQEWTFGLYIRNFFK